MPIITHNYAKSAELLAEIEAHDNLQEKISYFETLPIETFVREFTGSLHGNEFQRCADLLANKKLKILDIGVGQGQSSVYLAMQGHEVTSVEPSPHLCKVIDLMAQKANVTINIHECTMETFDIKDYFDVCIFNASFHHCDEPAVAAQNCYRALRENGRIFLINEPVLRFYKAKKSYYYALKNNPGKVLHYGGNEHVYRNHEYRSFLKKSNFQLVSQHVPANYFKPKLLLKFCVNYRGIDGYEYSYPNIVLRTIWYYLLYLLLKNPVVVAMVRETSLIACTFIGIKAKHTF